MTAPAWAHRAFEAGLPANLGDARDDDPAVRRAREVLRKMHGELAAIDGVIVGRNERRAFRLILEHLAAGFSPEARGSA